MGWTEHREQPYMESPSQTFLLSMENLRVGHGVLSRSCREDATRMKSLLFFSPYFFAGCILSCLLQLVPAQENLTVVSVPEHPIQGQSILLNAKNMREAFEQCEWTHPSGNKIIFTPDSKLTPTNAPQVVVVHRNCSLSIKNLRSSDQGRYTVKVTFPPAKQQEAKGPEILIGSIYLTFCGKFSKVILQTVFTRQCLTYSLSVGRFAKYIISELSKEPC